MAATQAQEGYGSTFQYSTDGGNTYSAAVSDVTKISAPNPEGKEIDASNLSSPNGFNEYLPGMVNGGEVTLELNFVKANYAAIYALYRTTIYVKITTAGGSTWVSQCFLTKFGTEIPHDDKISNTATFKVTGKPVFTQ